MSTEYTLLLFASMISVLICGYILGNEDSDRAEELADRRDFDRHVQQALWVARRTR
jgi:hypothetical protein